MVGGHNKSKQNHLLRQNKAGGLLLRSLAHNGLCGWSSIVCVVHYACLLVEVNSIRVGCMGLAHCSTPLNCRPTQLYRVHTCLISE
jgi:hypothetical protein